jgi:hypothetical protein
MNLLKLTPFILNIKGHYKVHASRATRSVKVILVAAFTLMFMSPIQAEPTDSNAWLKIIPEQCVALLQGQECYVNVELKWETTASGDYCLYSSLNMKALRCWENKKTGEFKQEFSSKNNIKFYLIHKKHLDNNKEKAQQNGQITSLNHSLNDIASAEIKMAWVHKKKGKPRTSWRMF